MLNDVNPLEGARWPPHVPARAKADTKMAAIETMGRAVIEEAIILRICAFVVNDRRLIREFRDIALALT